MMRSVVDFPQPEGPSKAAKEPASTLKLMLCKICVSPQVLPKPLTLTAFKDHPSADLGYSLASVAIRESRCQVQVSAAQPSRFRFVYSAQQKGDGDEEINSNGRGRRDSAKI